MAGVSKSTEKLVNIVVCVGAAVVIFGAWAKILHKPFADIMLTIGLLTEATIFLIYAFLPPPGGEMAAIAEALPKMAGSAGNPALQSLDKMLHEADITPTNLKKLSEGFNKLGTTVTQMKDVSDVVSATNEYAAKTKETTGALTAMKDAYTKSAATMQSFNDASESTKQFHGQVQVLTKNLSSLNTIYELELQESNNHLKALNAFYGKLSETSNSMLNSAEDAKRVQEQIGNLATNLGRLNSIYGNMLTAMQGRS